jgi:hypothetical protein
MWDGHPGVPASGIDTVRSKVFDRAHVLLMKPGPPSRGDVGWQSVLVFVAAFVTLGILRPPMVMKVPSSEYHRPSMSLTAALSWSMLTVLVAVGVRHMWN